MVLQVDEKIAEQAVLGGAFFGGGGGGSISWGRKYARIALDLGDVKIASVEEIPKEGIVLTCSMVGAPSSPEAKVTPRDCIRACELAIREIKEEVVGFISSENGGFSTVNGWVQAAAFDLPVIDAPADGRAHPTGKMGSMGLHSLPGYVSIQAGAGGDKSSGRYLEVVAKGSIENTAKIIREAAIRAGGLIGVARNPVTVDYLKENAAPGAISEAISVGKIFYDNADDIEALISALNEEKGVREVARGVVEEISLERRGGFDVGKAKISDKRGTLELVFWNEYMLARRGEEVLASFPDLIVTVDANTCLPVPSSELKRGEEVSVLILGKDLVKLGAGVRDPEAISDVEKAIGEKLR